ncbi:zinc finger BED domain-containing protein RICESLEEPER 2 [Hevea brasiliensis]|uniref:zinc finger BED domain-containing protein RICESLEEPER 2 n=1 Tax=Hevea brasiliensis TaxID=3981 RepID=UPI0025EF3A41|nr:zinc finger BED domain-containing protein RICESLEEPER 2 [Hevea brasiliensis]XP_021687542.2 zinc finger BED domain-containing protein RICESLEEPER 2 [Hevea brasiliensis]XP_021687546.2 zinc finger BED domain-containing protein RICESLEEPER 2 [Hevea brasiliensis]XP_058001315.1 zinc finger BED domain-containing protein RICESLEEPER 2 [Hevea brasiliensis]XP_058001316.1 zinc finger BED domain-containing protein RICESLEEPER 2 [Hevea brasiliensis]XP_058001317.1 zinc finger BED domain-containing protei
MHVYKVSVTTDLWKLGQQVSYMVVTAHFVDSNWNLQKRTLNFCDVPPPHIGVVICDVLQKCLAEWEIEDKIWIVSVDNAAYNDATIRMLKDNLAYKNSLALNGKFFHVRCCAHILNLLVQDGLSEIEDIAFNVRESVKHLTKAESRYLIFCEMAKQLKLPSKKLILDCGTRWNATYFMLSVALEFKDVFPLYQQRDPTYTFLPSEEDWEKVK